MGKACEIGTAIVLGTAIIVLGLIAWDYARWDCVHAPHIKMCMERGYKSARFF